MARWIPCSRCSPCCLCVSVSLWLAYVGRRRPRGLLVYVGTYTGAKSKGIHAFRFNQATGALTPVGLVAETPSPSWLALHPSGRFLYAANEVDDVRRRQERQRQRVPHRPRHRRADAAQHAAVPRRPSLPPDGRPAGHAPAGGQLHRRHACRAADRGRRSARQSASQVVQHKGSSINPSGRRRRMRTRSTSTPTTASRSPPTWAPTGCSSTATTPKAAG